MNEDYIAEAAEALAHEIDFDIMSGILIDAGWSKVVLRPMTWEHGYEVDTWVETQIKGKFHTMGLVWIFERAEDANWFSIRWL